MNAPWLAEYLWLLPVRTEATGAYSVFQFLATRKKAFTRIAEKPVESEVFAIFGLLLYSVYLVVVFQIANIIIAHVVAVLKGTVPLLIEPVFLAFNVRQCSEDHHVHG